MKPRPIPPCFAVFTVLAVFSAALWCTPVAAASKSKFKVAGSASYRERVALSSSAIFEATLEDASRADARADVIARARKTHPGQVPIAFQLSCDPRRIDARKTYVVRASVREGGRMRFRGSQKLRVASKGRLGKVRVLMRPVAREEGPELGNNRWRPIWVGGRVVGVVGQQREPWIELDPRSKRVTGSGGCNRISGTYESGDGTLRFGPLISTKMACPEMGIESAFLSALGETRRYRIHGRTLELFDQGGRVIARFEERNLR
jgi:putative lipoprotein